MNISSKRFSKIKYKIKNQSAKKYKHYKNKKKGGFRSRKKNIRYNLATIFGLASVIMTYYGVNYYLSGLHSYATGDPVPIPNWVYIVIICIIILSLLAYFRKRKYDVIS